LLGGEAVLAWFVAPRLGAELTLGLREGLPVDSAQGSVDSSSVAAGLMLCVALLPRAARWELFAKLGAGVSRLQFSGRGALGVVGRERALIAASARASLALQLWLAQALALAIDIGPGLPLAAAIAVDAEREIVGTQGVELHASLGLVVGF
jgi:hypothetical protein